MHGWISGANWSSKRTTLLCFINNRLVDCPLLKRSIEALYATLLPKGGHPWIYLSITINPANVDVNVHPTKKEVHFLNEDEIVEHICQAAQHKLAGANSSRTFAFSQAVLPILAPDVGPGASSAAASDSPTRPALREARSSSSSSSSTSANVARRSDGPISSSKGYPQHLVRVDAKTRTLDAMFTASTKAAGKKRAMDDETQESSISDTLADVAGDAEGPDSMQQHASSKMDASSESYADNNGDTLAPVVKRHRQSLNHRIADSESSLTSIRHLRAQIAKAQHRNFTDVVQNHTFVGVVDLHKGLSLIQHETRLLLVNHDALIREFAYQLVLRQFGSLRRTRLDPAPSLDDLVRLGLESTKGVPEDDTASIEANKDKIVALLLENAEMLQEYFSVCFNVEARTLEALPSLVPGTSLPGVRGTSAIELDRLPQLVVRLATRVNWQDEQECFDTFAKQIAWSCLPCPPPPLPDSTSEADEETQEQDKARQEEEEEAARRKIQHFWFDSMPKSRGKYVPSKATNDYVIQVANLPDLYRVFERC